MCITYCGANSGTHTALLALSDVRLVCFFDVGHAKDTSCFLPHKSRVFRVLTFLFARNRPPDIRLPQSAKKAPPPKVVKKKKAKKDPDAPKGASSGFMQFSQSERPRVRVRRTWCLDFFNGIFVEFFRCGKGAHTD